MVLMNDQSRELFKVLVGVAWIDGEISEEENLYLNGLAYKCNLSDDPEVQALLQFERPILFEDCLALIQSYLHDNRSEESFNRMVKSIKSLIRSDGVVASEEQAFLQVSNFLNEVAENPQIVAQLKECHRLEDVAAIALANGYRLERDSLQSVATQVEMEKKMQLVASAYLAEGEQIYEEDIQSANELIYDMLGLDLEFRVETVWVPDAEAKQMRSESGVSLLPGQLGTGKPPGKGKPKKGFWSFWQQK